MRTIYIRHADKNYTNGSAEYFKHDPGITEIGVERAKKIAIKLIELYGKPSRIVSSPYRRTRETSIIMNSMVSPPLPEIEIDSNISEYLGNHNSSELDVTIQTKIHKPPHPENFEQMKSRVKKHVEMNLSNQPKIREIESVKRYDKNSTGVTWFVTHGLIIKQIALHFNIKTSKELPYLTCFSILDKKDVLRAEFLLFKNIPKENEHVKKSIDLFLVPPKQEYTGRDDVTGRRKG